MQVSSVTAAEILKKCTQGCQPVITAIRAVFSRILQPYKSLFYDCMVEHIGTEAATLNLPKNQLTQMTDEALDFGGAFFMQKTTLRKRDLYLNRIMAFQDTEMIEVMTGI